MRFAKRKAVWRSLSTFRSLAHWVGQETAVGLRSDDEALDGDLCQAVGEWEEEAWRCAWTWM